MTGPELWAEFAAKTGVNADYDGWAFGDDPDGLAALVRAGVKTATSSAFPLYQLEGGPLPKTGGYSVILDSREEAVCVIRTTKVYTVPFRAVSPDHARKEGEGDMSLAHWRAVHRRFFARELAGAGLVFDEDMPVVCEEFEVVYPSKRFTIHQDKEC